MEKCIKEILKECNSQLWEILSGLENELQSIIKLQTNFENYNDHTYRHYKSIENFLDQIIPDQTKELFLAEEIFIMLSSALFHDIGLVLIS